MFAWKLNVKKVRDRTPPFPTAQGAMERYFAANCISPILTPPNVVVFLDRFDPPSSRALILQAFPGISTRPCREVGTERVVQVASQHGEESEPPREKSLAGDGT